ncbi:hypothetical protein Bbelb_051900 [Branchiostoma belcheri]|nr:hypothetical protein Bbelb_051900 [Branchiostoma belcheri]
MRQKQRIDAAKFQVIEEARIPPPLFSAARLISALTYLEEQARESNPAEMATFRATLNEAKAYGHHPLLGRMVLRALGPKEDEDIAKKFAAVAAHPLGPRFNPLGQARSVDGTNTAPRQDGTNTAPRQDGTNTAPRQDGTNTAPRQDGTNTAPRQDGTDTAPRQDGTNTDPRQDGTNTAPRQDGTNTAPRQDGTNTDPRQDGTNTDPRQDGTNTDPRHLVTWGTGLVRPLSSDLTGLYAAVEEYKGLFENGLKKSQDLYSRRQRESASEETLHALGWEIDSFQTLNSINQDLLSTMEEIISTLAKDENPTVIRQLREQLQSYIKAVYMKKREAASHLFIFMMSDEQRNMKPYAVRVRVLPCRVVNDAKIRTLKDELKRTRLWRRLGWLSSDLSRMGSGTLYGRWEGVDQCPSSNPTPPPDIRLTGTESQMSSKCTSTTKTTSYRLLTQDTIRVMQMRTGIKEAAVSSRLQTLKDGSLVLNKSKIQTLGTTAVNNQCSSGTPVQGRRLRRFRRPASDGADRVPWFGRVITTDPAKQHLTLRWHEPNEDGGVMRRAGDVLPETT